MEKIIIEDLCFSFPEKKRNVLSHINLKVKEGEFVTICGKSGCGKTTLLRHLKKCLIPAGSGTGTVKLDGRDISGMNELDAAFEIGFIMQDPESQIVCDRVITELSFGLENKGMNNDEILTRIAEISAYFGIQNMLYEETDKLSLGQKQLLNLASVMAMSPSVIVLDEPTASLDPIASERFISTIKKINEDFGVTVITAMHRLENVFSVSDRIAVMEDGIIIADEPPEKLAGILREKNSDMFEAMPTQAKVFALAEDGGSAPLTTGQGRAWLKSKKIYGIKEKKTLSDKIKVRTVLAKGLHFRYNKEDKDILCGLDFEAYEGEFCTVIGANGAGKSTFLMNLSGYLKPQRGFVKIAEDKKVTALVQNVMSLFSKETVMEELSESIAPNATDEREENSTFASIVRICHVENLLKCHPYDISGGERQRVAIAKALLTKPDILILDEPTRGLDAHFKRELAYIIKELTKNKLTVIAVSHDIEFCGEFSDRVAVFFNGRIIRSGTPKEIFSVNAYYTTGAVCMAKDIINGAVTDGDILEALGIKYSKPCSAYDDVKKIDIPKNTEENAVKKGNFVLFALYFTALLIWQFFTVPRLSNGLLPIISQTVSSLLLGAAIFCIVPKGKMSESLNIRTEKITNSGVIEIFMLVILALTIYLGCRFIENRKFFVLTLIVAVQTVLFFGLTFNKRKNISREIVLVSVLCACAVAGRGMFAAFYQFKPVAAIIIISSVCLGRERGFLIGAVSAFVSNFFFGQGPWTVWQMFAFGLVGFIAGVIFNGGKVKVNKINICIYGFASVFIIYGGIMNFETIIMSGVELSIKSAAAVYMAGIPFDLLHSGATVFFLWIAAEPMIKMLERIKLKYEI